MKTRIVRIGNSRGVRIPKPLLEQTGLRGEVEITAEDGSLVIRSARRPREGWAAAFEEMARRGDDALLDGVRRAASRGQVLPLVGGGRTREPCRSPDPDKGMSGPAQVYRPLAGGKIVCTSPRPAVRGRAGGKVNAR
jgi:antitoxin MazE